MNYNKIIEIEKRFTPDGFEMYLFGLMGGFRITEVETLENGAAASVMKGTAPIAERREQFLTLFSGLKVIADTLKKEAEIELPIESQFKMIQLTDTIFAVDVPSESSNFEFVCSDSKNLVFNPMLNGKWKDLKQKIILGLPTLENWVILGTVTPTEIDFDVKPIIADKIVEVPELGKCYQIITDGFMDYTYSDHRAFRSLLTSKAITTYEKLVIVELIK